MRDNRSPPMETLWDPLSATLVLAFAGAEEVALFAGRCRREGGCLVLLPVPLQQYQPVALAARLAGAEVRLLTRVLQVFPSGGEGHRVALELPDPAPLEALAGRPPAPPAAAEELAAAPAGETLGSSPAFRIRALDVAARMRLAGRAAKPERQILLRDNSPQVLLALFANPLLEEAEVLDLVKSPHATGGVLERLAKDPKWTASYDLRLALVKNPQTPTPLALRLLPALRRTDLQQLARSPHVREAIKGPALRLYLREG